MDCPPVTQLVAVDVGGTNARFALASVGADGAIALGEPVTLATSDYLGIEQAWAAFAARCGRSLPRAAAIAIAGPVTGEIVRMTNNSWVLHTGALDEQLGLDTVTVINDFGAVAHGVARAPADELAYICGPDEPLGEEATVSVIGPGTGLGVALFRREPGGGYHVQPTEGGHVNFAATDELDDLMLRNLRAQHGRVAVERVVAGPGIVAIHRAQAQLAGRAAEPLDDRAIWQRGLAGKPGGEDAACVAAVDRFCEALGSVAGDFALGHGASAVVIAGGIGLKLRDRLAGSGFAEAFVAKDSYEALMRTINVRLITHPQPGLYGAVAAFAQAHPAIA